MKLVELKNLGVIDDAEFAELKKTSIEKAKFQAQTQGIHRFFPVNFLFCQSGF